MLYELMLECNNFFPVEGAARYGRHDIKGGSIGLDLLPGQYFLIEGSVLNDGLHREWDTLEDETFTGYVCPLAVPKAFMKLAERVAEWCEKAGDVSPMQSESFGGYSYTRATGKNGGQMTWQEAFRQELNNWRKL